jgi:hypothetical protein
MTEINLIDEFYLPYKKQEETYASKEYKLLLENKIDPAKIVGLQPSEHAGVIKMGEEKEGQKESLFNDTMSFLAAVPKDFVISVARGGVNGFDFIKDGIEALTYGNTLTPEDSIFKFLEEKVVGAKETLNTYDKDDPLVAKMIGVIGLAFALGSTFAFDKETSFLLDTETINGLKSTINLNKDTPAEEMFDKMVQFIEFSGMGFAFNKLAPVFKSMKNIDVQKAATVTAGSTAAGAAAIAVQDNMQNNIISETTEKE